MQKTNLVDRLRVLVRSRRFRFGVVTALLAVALTVLAGEAVSRLIRGHCFLSLRLYQRGLSAECPRFRARDLCKYWNAELVKEYEAAFRHWPVPVAVFEAESRWPCYVFRPSSGIRNSFLFGPGLAGPDERADWSVNSCGFRGPEFERDKPEGTFRIVCMGASTTEGGGACSDTETYPCFLQQLLREKFPSHQVEVVNAGHHGYVLEDIIALFELEDPIGVRLLEPDLVIVYALANNVPFLAWTSAQCCERPRRPISDWLVSHSALSNAFFELTDLNRPAPREHPFGCPPGEMIRFKRLLARVPQTFGKARTPVVLCSFCTVVHPGLEVRRRTHPSLARVLHEDWYPLTYAEVEAIFDAYNGSIREVAEEQGVAYLDVAARFPKELRYFWDPYHFTPKGNRLLASLISEELCKEVIEAGPNGLHVRQFKRKR